MSLQSLITFRTIYDDINAYPFYLSKCALLCWHEFQLLKSVAMLLQCALVFY